MPANFTDEERKSIRSRLLAVGYDLIRETGIKKMKISTVSQKAEIATGTFYHFFPSKEVFVQALIEEREKNWQEQLFSGLPPGGKLSLVQAIYYFRESFRVENNLLMEISLEDWVWLKTHRTEDGLFGRIHEEQEIKRYLPYIDGIRPDADIRVIINFFKTIYSMAQNRDTFIEEVFETNIDMIFACIYQYAAIPEQEKEC